MLMESQICLSTTKGVDSFFRAYKGYAIMGALSRWGKENGAVYGYLQVEGDNPTALRMYEKLGFVDVYRYAYWKR